MFFYQTQFLGIDSAVLGVSKVFGQAAMILWSVIYNRRLKSVPPRKLISAIQVQFFFKILPFSVLIAQLCPPGCKGSLMAFVMSAIALSFIVSGYLGMALASYVSVTGSDFSGLPQGLLIQAVCTLLPLFWSAWIPDDVKAKTRKVE